MLGLALSTPALRRVARWWPDGAVFAADFVARRYMRNGVEVAEADAFTFSRPSAAWSTQPDGSLVAHAAHEPRFVAGGLLLEPARTRLSLGPVHLGTSQWTNTSGAVSTPLAAEGLFAAPVRVASGGLDFSRRVSSPLALTAGLPVTIKVLYRPSTSPNFGVYIRSNSANLQSVLSGPLGELTSTFTYAGTWGEISNRTRANMIEVEATFTPVATQADWLLGLSPRSQNIGDSVDVFAACALDGIGTSSWILGNPLAETPREQESLSVVSLPSEGTFTTTAEDGHVTYPFSGGMIALSTDSAPKVLRSLSVQP